MITLESGSLILLILAAALAGTVIAVLPAWRRRADSAPGLPVWSFVRRQNVDPGRHGAVRAQLRCEMCDAKGECRRLLAEGVDLPAAGCPNGELFGAPGKT